MHKCDHVFSFVSCRSGYDLGDSVEFAARIERMLRMGVGVDVDAPVSCIKREGREDREGREKRG